VPETSCNLVDKGDFDAFLDGELSFERQSTWYSHLAACAVCRTHLDVYLEFRNTIRDDFVSLPSAVDDMFFQRLEKRRTEPLSNHRGDRRTLNRVRIPVSLRTLGVAIALLVLFGLLIPNQDRVEALPPSAIVQNQEAVHIERLSEMVLIQPYPLPGLIIESEAGN
jgi:anti-sigma factor RsiW